MATKTEIVGIRISPEEKELIQRLAQKEDVTVSKFLYKKIVKVLEEEENNANKLS